MEDIFKDFSFIIVYIDDLLVYSRDIAEHKSHLESFYQTIHQHGLALSNSSDKFIITKTRIEYLGLFIS